MDNIAAGDTTSSRVTFITSHELVRKNNLKNHISALAACKCANRRLAAAWKTAVCDIFIHSCCQTEVSVFSRCQDDLLNINNSHGKFSSLEIQLRFCFCSSKRKKCLFIFLQARRRIAPPRPPRMLRWTMKIRQQQPSIQCGAALTWRADEMALLAAGRLFRPQSCVLAVDKVLF